MATIQGQELCSKVEAFLASGPLKGWVGGKGVEAADGGTFTTHDPGTGEVLAEVFSYQKADVDAAVTVADDALRFRLGNNARERKKRHPASLSGCC